MKKSIVRSVPDSHIVMDTKHLVNHRSRLDCRILLLRHSLITNPVFPSLFMFFRDTVFRCPNDPSKKIEQTE